MIEREYALGKIHIKRFYKQRRWIKILGSIHQNSQVIKTIEDNIDIDYEMNPIEINILEEIEFKSVWTNEYAQWCHSG